MAETVAHTEYKHDVGITTLHNTSSAVIRQRNNKDIVVHSKQRRLIKGNREEPTFGS